MDTEMTRPDGAVIKLPEQYDMATGKPKPGTKIVASKPDAVNFKTGTILDDKPAGDIGQHREQLFRYIRAYKEATGQMPKEIIIEFYTPQTFEPAGRLVINPASLLPPGYVP